MVSSVGLLVVVLAVILVILLLVAIVAAVYYFLRERDSAGVGDFSRSLTRKGREDARHQLFESGPIGSRRRLPG